MRSAAHAPFAPTLRILSAATKLAFVIGIPSTVAAPRPLENKAETTPTLRHPSVPPLTCTGVDRKPPAQYNRNKTTTIK